MGWLARRRERKAQRAAQKRARTQAEEQAAWQAEDAHLHQLLDDARSNDGAEDGFGLMLKPNERTFQVLQGASLIEPRRLPGHWEGRSQGFSIPVAGGVRYRVGSTKGHYVQGAEKPTPIDTGTVTITNQRVVFQGTTASREWTFTKLLGVQHVDDPKRPWTAIQVSNRQKTSGFTYTADVAAQVRFRLDLALAHYHGDVDHFIAALESEIEQHGLERPTTTPEPPVSPVLAPPPPPPPSPPPTG